MAGDEPEKGDKVSWAWGGGAPGGTVAEKKKEGEVAITSKRGNKIKKNAEPNDPAVHIERSGNDVVKKASELNVEKKASGKSGDSEGGESQKDSKKEEHGKTEKRKADDEKDEEEPHVKNAEGKEVKAGGKAAHKKQKQDKEKEDKTKTKKDAGKKEDTKEADEKKDDDEKDAPVEKRKPGRPKGSGESKKSKKEPTPREGGDIVSSRTRSRGK